MLRAQKSLNDQKPPRLRCYLYGPGGVGKTMAAIKGFPKPYIIDTESGCEHYRELIDEVGGAVYQTTDLDRMARLLNLPAFDEHPTFRIRVYQAGVHKATHTVPAADVQAAIAAVEEEMDIQPPQVTRDRDGNLAIKGWHGYEFRVRRVEDAS